MNGGRSSFQSNRDYGLVWIFNIYEMRGDSIDFRVVGIMPCFSCISETRHFIKSLNPFWSSAEDASYLSDLSFLDNYERRLVAENCVLH